MSSKSGTIAVRDLASSDHDAAVALWIEAWMATLPQIRFNEREPFIRARLSEFAIAPKRARIAIVGAEPVGFALTDPSTGELEQIAVRPAFWGDGIAEALMGDVKSYARGRIFLAVNRDNPRAIAFYIRHGFNQTGASLSPRSGLPLMHMEWRAD